MPRERCDPWKLISRKDAKTQIIVISYRNIWEHPNAPGEVRPLEVNFAQRRKDADNRNFLPKYLGASQCHGRGATLGS